MATDAYTKTLLAVIAASCAAIAYQSFAAPDFPDYPEPCGLSEYSPCYVVAAEAEGLKIASGDGAIGGTEPIMVRVIDHEPISVNLVDWNYRDEVDVEITNWP